MYISQLVTFIQCFITRAVRRATLEGYSENLSLRMSRALFRTSSRFSRVERVDACQRARVLVEMAG